MEYEKPVFDRILELREGSALRQLYNQSAEQLDRNYQYENVDPRANLKTSHLLGWELGAGYAAQLSPGWNISALCSKRTSAGGR